MLILSINENFFKNPWPAHVVVYAAPINMIKMIRATFQKIYWF